jgi:hypothetical protein
MFGDRLHLLYTFTQNKRKHLLKIMKNLLQCTQRKEVDSEHAVTMHDSKTRETQEFILKCKSHRVLLHLIVLLH